MIPVTEHPFTGMPVMKVYADIVAERVRQDNTWGEQHHDIFKWLAILGEEVGEANKAVLDVDSYLTADEHAMELIAHVRKELIQVAAVAVEIIEKIDHQMLELREALA